MDSLKFYGYMGGFVEWVKIKFKIIIKIYQKIIFNNILKELYIRIKQELLMQEKIIQMLFIIKKNIQVVKNRFLNLWYMINIKSIKV